MPLPDPIESAGSPIDDLLMYLFAYLPTDPVLQAIYTAAGATSVAVTDEENRALAGYPRMVMTGDEGVQHSTGDLNRPKFFDGLFRIEAVARQSRTCPEPLATVMQIFARHKQLILGHQTLGLPGIKGLQISTQYNVTAIYQCNPTRRLPVIDPTMKRHLTTYHVKMNDITLL